MHSTARLALFLVVLAVGSIDAQTDRLAQMAAWSKALGVECTHCHVDGQWSDRSKPTFEFAQRMMRMVNGLNAGKLKDLGGITCWTCHRGHPRPARLPRPEWESIQANHQADFAEHPDRALAMSVYSASLGVECHHCHEPGNWAANTKPAKATATTMTALFDEIPTYFEPSRMPTTQCYMCHQGRTTPER